MKWPLRLLSYVIQIIVVFYIVTKRLMVPISWQLIAAVPLWCILQQAFLESRLQFLRQSGRVWLDTIRTTTSQSLETVRRNPMSALLVASALGFVLAAVGSGGLYSVLDHGTRWLANLALRGGIFWWPAIITTGIVLVYMTRWKFYSRISIHASTAEGLQAFVPSGGGLHVVCLSAACILAFTMLRVVDNWSGRRTNAVATQQVQNCLNRIPSRIESRRKEISDRIARVIKDSGDQSDAATQRVRTKIMDFAADPSQLKTYLESTPAKPPQKTPDPQALPAKFPEALKKWSPDRIEMEQDLLDLKYLFELKDKDLVLRQSADEMIRTSWGRTGDSSSTPAASRPLVNLILNGQNRPEAKDFESDGLTSAREYQDESIGRILINDYTFPKPYDFSKKLRQMAVSTVPANMQEEERKVLVMFLFSMTFAENQPGKQRPDPALWSPQGESLDRLFEGGKVLDVLRSGLLDPISNPANEIWPIGLTTVRLREMIRGVIQTVTFVFLFWGCCVLFWHGIIRNVVGQLSYLPLGDVMFLPAKPASEPQQTWRDAWNFNAELLLPEDGSDRRAVDIYDAANRSSDLIPGSISAAMRAAASATSPEGAISAKIEKWRKSIDEQNGFLDFIAFALPNLGFLGTIVGIGQGLSVAYSIAVPSSDPFHKARVISEMTSQLGTAFYTTLVALVCVLPFVLMTYSVRRMQDFVGQVAERKLLHLADHRISMKLTRTDSVDSD